MRLYHRTDAVEAILARGFRDAIGTFLTDQEFTGVWFSDQPLDENEGARGEYLLSLDIPDEALEEFEWVEDGKPNREFLIPAELANRFGPPAQVAELGDR